ncbi:MAG: hypothetical protein ACK4N5_08720 [Myxococcales bacterium]
MKAALVLAALVAAAFTGCREPRPQQPAVETLPPQPLPDQPDPVAPAEPVRLGPGAVVPLPLHLTVYVVPSVRAVGAEAPSLAADELVFRAEVQNGTPGDVVVLELETPGGHPWQQLTAEANGTPLVAEFRLPVAGTWIQQQELTGRWTARYLVGGAHAATDVFELIR